MKSGEEVLCLDNTFTGRKANIRQWWNTLVSIYSTRCNEPIKLELIVFAPISRISIHYQTNPVKTPRLIFLAHTICWPARRVKARLLLASTSEVYGDREEHPQPESYCGYVNPIGIRACYDEGKRIAETLCFDYRRMHGTEIRVARVFNTYGPRMYP